MLGQTETIMNSTITIFPTPNRHQNTSRYRIQNI